MADVVASGILNSLLDRLTGRMVEKFGWLTDVGAELEKLEGTLSTIRDVLEDAEARQVKEKALIGWLRRLKDVAYDIDDLLDEDFAKNLKRSAPESSTSSMKGKVSSLLSLPNSIMSQRKIGREIREIRERLDQLADDRFKFHLQERSVVTYCRQENVMRETGSFVIESEVYGREEDKKKIIEFLVDTSGGDLEVIAIVGMGGVGKTTLAQLVYNDQQISSHFEKKMKIWVCVSDDFDPTRLVGSIIEQTTGSRPCNLTSMELMESKLKEALEKKKFLLVLDDVWNENYIEWDGLRRLLTIGATGSKVVVTTRNHKIPLLMTAAKTHILKVLSEDHCWLLFEKIVFGSGACEKTTNLVTIGKEIVKKCGGVPLAAKVLGGLMLSKREENEWLAVRDNDSWKSEENDILPALRLSYNHLPSHLKQCFTYFSMFPKDTSIKDETLVELWIAEGFIRRPNKNEKLKDVGYQYLRELLSRSLFEEGTTNIWLRGIKMHDLVHDLAQSISGEECSSIDIAGNRRDIYPMTRYSSFTYTKEATPLILDILNEAKKLRTFYFLNLYPFVEIRNEDVEIRDEAMMLKILDTVFSSMKLLRALHIDYYCIKELPMPISNLRHLRYLNLSLTKLETLPHSIGSLQNLHILKLPNCYSLKELPVSIGSLSDLLTLNLDTCHSLVSLPTSIGNLSNLLTLSLSNCRSFVSLPTSIGSLSDLLTLNLDSCHSLVSLPDSIGNLSNLLTLDLANCSRIVSLPTSIGNLSNLLTLNLKSCRSIVSLPTSIGDLSNLSTLSLSNCQSFVSLPTFIGSLSNLLTLDLSSYRNIVSLPTFIGDLSNLLTLDLSHCESIVSLPTSIGNLSNLLTLNLKSCHSLVSLPTSIGHLKSLQTLNLMFTKIEKLPESLCCLSNLRSINLICCDSLLELPENMKDMKSLTNLHTSGCSKLTGMPSGIGQLSHLRELPLFVVSEKSECGLRELNGLNLLEGRLEIPNLENVKNFQEARDANLVEKHRLERLQLSWGLDTYKRQDHPRTRRGRTVLRALALAEKVLEGLQPHQNLTGLSINGYQGKIFPKWLESSSSLPNLVDLNLYSCFRCETLLEISQLHNLRTLFLWKLPAVKSLPPLGHLPHLKDLHLIHLLAVKSLGSEFYGTGDGAFPVLEKLRLEYMLELEEWCEASTAGQQRSFPRLSSLSLKNCPKLKVLPSSLPSLEHLALGADYELLVSSIPRGAFPILKNVYLENFDEFESPVPQIVAERLTFVSCRRGDFILPMVADDELNLMRSFAGLP